MSTSTAPTQTRSTQHHRDDTSNWPTMLGTAVAAGAGVLFVVLGLVALARTGIPTSVITEPHVSAGWLHATPLLAIVHLLLGAAFLGTASTNDGAIAVGVVLAIAGMVLWIEPAAFHGTLGAHVAHGVTYTVIGVLAALAAVPGSPRFSRF